MDTSAQHWFDILRYCAWGAFFGLCGGFARLLRKGARGWLDFLAQVFVSAFCGFLVFALMEGQIDDLTLAALAGIAGNSGGTLLDVIRMKFMRAVREK
jgi:H+/Cl- antiporter ClcA